ncbi:hypothetical protein UA08_05644 [Talaromyces atroroseus]|uniref:Methionyl-tRNA formyltransferase n=1 Tax=Talaromyces atroroseus TaxID=1441469 RepID=A0A225ACL6_TALAT|nr:hypothetical protein UA08_05644 [Talaromyces atroroseus]OKL58852.1 hypothetical protein UA08_05644 [Talaromyces atroroseus]
MYIACIVPIKTTATNLGLKIHELDTFKGWTPPDGPFDLIIAVSFGLFIPSRLLSAAKYGGLNVHPSLLPDLRGPAPLHHTLISGRKTTGITLQTLHHKHFDHGIILDQTPAPVPNPDSCTVSELLDFLAPKGANMLVNGIRNRYFVPPLKEVGSRATVYSDDGSNKFAHAAKITPEDRHIDWQNWTWTQISRRQRVLQPLWNKALVPTRKKTDGDITQNLNGRRIIFGDLQPVPQETVPESEGLKLLPGVPFISTGQKSSLFVYTVDGQLLRLSRLKVEGDKFNDALIAAQKARMFSPNTVRFSDVEFSLFLNPLH